MGRIFLFLIMGLPGLLPQEESPGPRSGPSGPESSPLPKSGAVEWKEGVPIPVRIPIAAPGRELMTTLSFPEESIETAVAGWPEGDITAIPKRGLLFLRLTKKSEGQLNVIGGSGTHYLVYLTGVEGSSPEAYDAYLRIDRKEGPRKGAVLPKRQSRRPGGALELLQAMRLGLRTEGTRILRAARELVYESSSMEIRLLYVYEAPSYRGFLYEVRNRTRDRQSVDASRLHGKGAALVLSALRENVLEPDSTTRLYAVTAKD